MHNYSICLLLEVRLLEAEIQNFPVEFDMISLSNSTERFRIWEHQTSIGRSEMLLHLKY